MAWEYTEKTKQLFMDAVHGKPGTHMGEIEDADGVGEHGSIACGDAMRFSFRVERDPKDATRDVIVEAKYLTFGCTSAIAASEALCSLLEGEGYTPIGALRISNDEIVKFLGGLPAQKIHCSVMGAEALEAAVFDWARKRGVDLAEHGVELPNHEEEEGRMVCECFGSTEPYLKRKIEELELKTIADVAHSLKAGGACSSCHHVPGGLQDILDEVWGRGGPRAPEPVEEESASTLSPYQYAKRVEKVVDEYVRPMLAKDGGGLEIVDIKGHLVYAQLLGACQGCAGASQTLKMAVERTLRDQVDQEIRVIAV